MVFFDGLNHGLNQWFKPIGLNQPTLHTRPKKIIFENILSQIWIFPAKLSDFYKNWTQNVTSQLKNNLFIPFSQLTHIILPASIY